MPSNNCKVNCALMTREGCWGSGVGGMNGLRLVPLVPSLHVLQWAGQPYDGKFILKRKESVTAPRCRAEAGGVVNQGNYH